MEVHFSICSAGLNGLLPSMFVFHFRLIWCSSAQILVCSLRSDTLGSVGPSGVESGILRGHFLLPGSVSA